MELTKEYLDEQLGLSREHFDEQLGLSREHFDEQLGLSREHFDEQLKTLATKEELKKLATKQDIKNFPTKQEVREIVDESVSEGVENLARIIATTVAEPMERHFEELKDYIQIRSDVTRIKQRLHMK